MNILEINIHNYRNLCESNIKFDSGTNFIYGKNAQGKTNLIEAVWMFTGARSFRGTKDSSLISFEKKDAFLKGVFNIENRTQEIDLFFDSEKRKAFLNGVPQRYPTHIIGTFRTVLFVPAHLSLISGGPEGRRRFLDAAICQLKPTYTALLVRYSQTLRQRNALLKKLGFGGQKSELLDVLDESLAELGSKITKSRTQYVKDFKPSACEFYSEISKSQEVLDINYICSALKGIDYEPSDKELANLWRVRLKNHRVSDLNAGFTLCGPHKDELEITINSKAVKAFGSQGQQRSAALAFKLSEACVQEQKLKDSPVILLDDVMSELDDRRISYMIKKLEGRQTFITSCSSRALKSFSGGSLFFMDGGKAKKEKSF